MESGVHAIPLPGVAIAYIARLASDHGPVILNTLGDRDMSPRPFRFEGFWTNDARSIKVVDRAWQYDGTDSLSYSLCQCLKATKVALISWNKEMFSNRQVQIRNLQVELDLIQQENDSMSVGDQEK